MMRGMFTAISGLKQHQTMLDVTANDIANVNTIGYKSSRVTFQDTLTQLQRGAVRREHQHRRLERGAGRPRRRAGLDRQPDDRRRAADHRPPAGRRDPGRRVPAVGEGAPTGRRPTDAERSTPAPATSRRHQGYLTTQGGQYVLGYAMPARHRPDRADQDPGRRHRHRHRPTGGVSYVDPATSTRVTAVPDHARHVPERGRPGARRRQHVGRRRPTPARAVVNLPGVGRHGHPEPPARSRCPTSTSPRRSRT